MKQKQTNQNRSKQTNLRKITQEKAQETYRHRDTLGCTFRNPLKNIKPEAIIYIYKNLIMVKN